MSPRAIDTGSNRHGTRHVRRSRPADWPFQVPDQPRHPGGPAERAETASFRIEQSELQRWLDATDVIRATVLDGLAENPATGAEHAALEVQIERFKEAADLLRAQLADKCSQLADALAQRDEWREAFKQQRALPPPQPAPQGWGRWLALTTLLAMVVTAAIVAAATFAIWWFALVVERPVDTVDRLALTEFREAGAPARSAALRAR